MRLPIIDPFSFVIGFLTTTIFWWLVSKGRPLFRQIRQGARERGEATQARKTSSIEENHRRMTFRRAQGMHLAAPLFSLNEILQTPLLLAPLARVEPEGALLNEDIVSQTLPYLPDWPELAAIYNAPTLTIPQALSGGCNIVITGQPGIGKTVALAYLASLAANHEEQLGNLRDAVPFLLHIGDVDIADIKDVLNPIINAVSEYASIFDLAGLPGFIQYTFRSGSVLLLLDGLDELPTETQQGVTAYIKALLKAFPKIRIVTTGCPEYLDGLLELEFVPLSLMAWGGQQCERFVQQWGELWTQYVAVEAWAQAGPEQVDPILLSNWLNTNHANLSPLELTLKVWGAYAGDTLGPSALDAIAMHLRRIAPAGVPLAALEMLAMQASLTAQPMFDPRKAREWVKSFEPPEETQTEEKNEEEEKKEIKKGREKSKGQKNSPTPGLLAKMTASGLLVSHPDNRMRFVHPVFLGYLAGRALAGYNAEETLLNQPAWSGKTLTMRYLAVHGDATRLTEALLQTNDPPLHRPLFTAARLLRDAPREVAWRAKVLTTLVSLLQNEGQPLGLRGQVMAAFVLSGDPGAAAVFRQFLQSSSFELVQLAALGAGALQDAKSIDHLAAIFHTPTILARRAACLALVAIDSTPALEVVADALLHGDEDLRRAAAEALANHPSEGHAMLRDGASMEDNLIRRAVVFGLARVKEPWAVEALQKIQVEDDQWVVRNSASEVLESREQPDLRIPRPLPRASESVWLIAFASTLGLGISPGAPATDILLAALKSENEEERLAALPYLKRTPTSGVLGSMYHAMYSNNLEMRETVFQILLELAAGGVTLPNPQEFGVG